MKKVSRFFFYLICALSAHTSSGSLFEIPKANINEAGKSLIFEFEGCDLRPAWAGGASGVDIGYGYDAGYYSRATILSDWSLIAEKDRAAFADTSGVTGRKAKALTIAIHWIRIWEGAAESVFLNVDIPREYDRCKRAFPGFVELRPNAQAALISLGYNRGYSMTGDGRREMRSIRDLSPKQDYAAMAAKIRDMKRLWRGTSIERGMTHRRDAEAGLMLQP
jgi:GH24 family phage-related lysozyme (muramidase)